MFVCNEAQVPTEFWSNDDLHENQEPFLEWIMAVGNDTSPPYVFSVSCNHFSTFSLSTHTHLDVSSSFDNLFLYNYPIDGDDEYTISEDYANRCNVEFQKQG